MTETAQTPNPITTIEQAGAHAGGTVTIRGWLYNLRESGKLWQAENYRSEVLRRW